MGQFEAFIEKCQAQDVVFDTRFLEDVERGRNCVAEPPSQPNAYYTAIETAARIYAEERRPIISGSLIEPFAEPER